jgi:bifunctional non-homologous end joining protein LigD
MGETELERYRAKRDFSVTPEPSPEEPGQAPEGEGARFVVQEHHARALHWDFRLERDGVLVSWAVPKGVPPDPSVNHLAVPTEDHPMSYIDFEGEIPQGNYGGGKVSIWDRGTYECVKWDRREVMVVLHGQRVHGRYVLFRTGENAWMIHRMDPPEDPDRKPLPAALDPMRAVPGDLPTDDAEWAFEVLWDGQRTLAFSEGGRPIFRDSHGADVTSSWPELRALGRSLGSHEVVLDGVVAVTDDEGRPDRAALEQRQRSARPPASRATVAYLVFDVVHLDGRSLTEVAYEQRRRLLDDLHLAGAAWQVPPNHVGDGGAFLQVARARDLPGVVAKRLASPYRPGARSQEWVEVRP